MTCFFSTPPCSKQNQRGPHVTYFNTTKRNGPLVGTVFSDTIELGLWPAILKYNRSLLIVIFIAMFVMRIRRWFDVNDALNMKRYCA